MLLFNTLSVDYLAEQFSMPKGRLIRRKLSDGEWYIKIEDKVDSQPVLVLASTPTPAETIIELLLLLNALYKNGAKIHLMLTYFGYGRQDEPKSGEAHAAQLMASLISQVRFENIWIVHNHSFKLHEWLSYQDIIPYAFFNSVGQKADIIVAPDEGAKEIASVIAKHLDIPAICLKKSRPAQEMVEVESFDEDIQGKRVLIIDDLIATGNTIAQVSHMLKSKGAHEINVAATHGIFSNQAIEQLQQSPIDMIYVTNTVKKNFISNKITMIDIGKELEELMSQHEACKNFFHEPQKMSLL